MEQSLSGLSLAPAFWPLVVLAAIVIALVQGARWWVERRRAQREAHDRLTQLKAQRLAAACQESRARLARLEYPSGTIGGISTTRLGVTRMQYPPGPEA